MSKKPWQEDNCHDAREVSAGVKRWAISPQVM